MLDFRMQTFLTVCEEMNYTKAAERLHITRRLCRSIFIIWNNIMDVPYLRLQERN